MTDKLTLELAYQGDGTFRTASPFDFKLAQKQLGEGEVIRVSVSRGRSSKQNRMFHALVQAAFDNQVGGPAVETVSHLRSWLLIRAGHCQEIRIPLGKTPPDQARRFMSPLTAWLRQQYDTIETAYDTTRHEIVARVAKPWRFSKTDHTTATEVMEKVIAEICGTICPGTTPENLLSMAERDAA